MNLKLTVAVIRAINVDVWVWTWKKQKQFRNCKPDLSYTDLTLEVELNIQLSREIIRHPLIVYNIA